MFTTDQPKTKISEDALGMANFAIALGDAVLKYDTPPGLVIGIEGEWGSGKTSAINMAVDHILNYREDIHEQPIIMWFRPWNITDHDQLINQFFIQLSSITKKQKWGKAFKKLSRLMIKYGSVLSGQAISLLLGPVAAGVFALISATGTATQLLHGENNQSLASLKDEISETLSKSKRKILVIIDDIDRLSSQEVNQIFQLVKSVADFPNVVYLLAYDKEIVANALDSSYEDHGSEYLEKIVQVPFRLPKISDAALNNILFGELEHLLNLFPEDRWNAEYWNSYSQEFTQFFHTTRDINRYTNILKFYVSLIGDEVNPVDLIILTALELFESGVFEAIYLNERFYTDVFHPLALTSRNEKEFESRRATLNETLKLRRSPISEDALKKIIERLFPRMSQVSGAFSIVDPDTLAADKRVCSPDHFVIYFRLAIRQGQISDSRLKHIIDLGNKKEELSALLDALLNTGELEQIVRQLRHYNWASHDDQCITRFFMILSLISGSDLDSSSEYQIRTLLEVLLTYLDETPKFNLLSGLIDIEKIDFIALCELTKKIGDRIGYIQHHRIDEPLPLTHEHFETLKDQIVARIKDMYKNDGFPSHETYEYMRILSFWKAWDNSSYQAYVDELMSSDEGIIQIVETIVCEVYTVGAPERKSQYYVDWRDVARLFIADADRESILPRLDETIQSIIHSPNFEKYSNKRKTKLQTFLDNIKPQNGDQSTIHFAD